MNFKNSSTVRLFRLQEFGANASVSGAFDLSMWFASERLNLYGAVYPVRTVMTTDS